MKQQKLSGYQPNYPKKAMRGAALAAAALFALGTSTGCNLRTDRATGFVPDPDPTPGEELILDGETRIDPQEMGYVAPEPTDSDEWLRTDGLIPVETTPEPDEVELMGDVAIIEP